MNAAYELLEYPRPTAPGQVVIPLFGKAFPLAPVSPRPRILRHRYYPLVGQEELAEFAAFALAQDRCVISGAKTRHHPYRLLHCNEDLCGAFAMNIPQSVRGDRHLYPEIFCFVPALVSVPPGTDARALQRPEDIIMHPLPCSLLLDASDILDSLLLASQEQRPGGEQP